MQPIATPTSWKCGVVRGPHRCPKIPALVVLYSPPAKQHLPALLRGRIFFPELQLVNPKLFRENLDCICITNGITIQLALADPSLETIYWFMPPRPVKPAVEPSIETMEQIRRGYTLLFLLLAMPWNYQRR
jgi:hypothetical protein